MSSSEPTKYLTTHTVKIHTRYKVSVWQELPEPQSPLIFVLDDGDKTLVLFLDETLAQLPVRGCFQRNKEGKQQRLLFQVSDGVLTIEGMIRHAEIYLGHPASVVLAIIRQEVSA